MMSASQLVPALAATESHDAGETTVKTAAQRRKKDKSQNAKHRPESLGHAITIAWCDWAAGMVIGLMPLLCHLLLHFAARSAPDWDDN